MKRHLVYWRHQSLPCVKFSAEDLASDLAPLCKGSCQNLFLTEGLSFLIFFCSRSEIQSLRHFLTKMPPNSCGARKKLRAYAYPCFFRPRRQTILAVSPTGRARILCSLHKGGKRLSKTSPVTFAQGIPFSENLFLFRFGSSFCNISRRFFLFLRNYNRNGNNRNRADSRHYPDAAV